MVHKFPSQQTERASEPSGGFPRTVFCTPSLGMARQRDSSSTNKTSTFLLSLLQLDGAPEREGHRKKVKSLQRCIGLAETPLGWGCHSVRQSFRRMQTAKRDKLQAMILAGLGIRNPWRLDISQIWLLWSFVHQTGRMRCGSVLPGKFVSAFDDKRCRAARFDRHCDTHRIVPQPLPGLKSHRLGGKPLDHCLVQITTAFQPRWVDGKSNCSSGHLTDRY
jgi:hypothetical protein